MATGAHAGPLLREWRERRSLSQLELAGRSAVSARHLSFIETGRSRPSREMVLHLAQRLEVPLRDRNRLLLAAGYAPAFSERALDEAGMAPVREALERFLAAHEPYPAVVVDRHWNIAEVNTAVSVLTDGIAPDLLDPPANALRATLHPRGLAPRILNFEHWSAHLLSRLRRQVELTGDEGLEELHAELSAYPGVQAEASPADEAVRYEEILLPLHMRYRDTELSLFSTVTTFGTPFDVTLAELAIEAFYPATPETASVLMRL